MQKFIVRKSVSKEFEKELKVEKSELMDAWRVVSKFLRDNTEGTYRLWKTINDEVIMECLNLDSKYFVLMDEITTDEFVMFSIAKLSKSYNIEAEEEGPQYE